MDLAERVILLVVGGGFGFILGLIVARLQDIKNEVDEVLTLEKERHDVSNNPHETDERGSAITGYLPHITLLVVVLITVFAALSSQRSSNNVEDTQDSIEAVTMCNQRFLGQLLYTVNERTTFSADQAKANIELQKVQSRYITTLLANPPESVESKTYALKEYYDKLTNYISVNSQAAKKLEENQYPTIDQFNSCVDSNMKKAQDE